MKTHTTFRNSNLFCENCGGTYGSLPSRYSNPDKMKTEEYTWEDLLKNKSPRNEPGKVYGDWFDDGVRCLILQGPTALCAYLGVPLDHPLANKDYDDLPVTCHGGLTYAGKGDGKFRPEGFYWYGWDYSHSGDYSFYYDDPSMSDLRHSDEKKWLPRDVESDMWGAVWDLKKLMKLAESIQTQKV